MKTLLIAITLFTSSAFAGELQYSGSAPIGSCSMFRSSKQIIESEKQFAATIKKMLKIASTEEKKLKYAEMLEKSKESIQKAIEMHKHEYYYVFPMNFVFSGDGSYALNYPQTTILEGTEFKNYEVNTLNSPFIQYTDETHFVTQIPGSWSVSVEVTSGFICGHPSNQNVDSIDKQAVERVARDFFIEN